MEPQGNLKKKTREEVATQVKNRPSSVQFQDLPCASTKDAPGRRRPQRYDAPRWSSHQTRAKSIKSRIIKKME
jgi:hypothetical protein